MWLEIETDLRWVVVVVVVGVEGENRDSLALVNLVSLDLGGLGVLSTVKLFVASMFMFIGQTLCCEEYPRFPSVFSFCEGLGTV